MRHAFPLAVLGLVAAASVARAADVVDLSPLITDRTVLVARVDVSKVNYPAAADWAVQTLAGAKVPADLAKTLTASLVDGARQMQQQIDALTKAGVTQLGLVVNLNEPDIRGEPIVLIAVATADPDAITAVLQPLSRTPFQITDLDGVSVWAASRIPNYVGGLTPAARPELVAAVADPGGAAVVAGGGVAEAVRAELAAVRPGRDPFDLPAAVSPVANINSATLRVEAGAQPHVLLSTQVKSADAVQKWIESVARNPMASALKALPLKTAGNTVSIDLRQPEIQQLVTLLVPPLTRARAQANRIKSMSNMRQLMMGVMMFCAENKGVLPKQMDDAIKLMNLQPAGRLSLLSNPLRPELGEAGYIFVPAREQQVSQIKRSSERLAMYEAGDFDNGVNVAFWDGHVEFVASRDHFDALLATAQPPAAPAP